VSARYTPTAARSELTLTGARNQPETGSAVLCWSEMPTRSSASLGEIIRHQRELAEMSMRQFAELAGISNPYLSQIERGLRAPSEQVLEGIAGALKVSSEALYRQAGMDPPGIEPADNAVLDAIAVDPRLTTRQRAALREVYHAFTGSPPRPRRRSNSGKRPA
jgi:transcriptional regulator with XRE-family HTH domain